MEHGRVFLSTRNLGELLDAKIDYLENEKIYAIHYLNTIYLPVRLIAENLGFEVVYDDNTINIKTDDVNNPGEMDQADEKSLTYSNLVDSASQAEVRQAMEAAGILGENIDDFFREVDIFNGTINARSLVEHGFSTIDGLEPEYHVLEMMELWDTKFPLFIGYNCRMTSYGLMKDAIYVGKPGTTNEGELFFDKNALENSPKEIFSPADQEAFLTLFSFIPTKDTKDRPVHLESIKEYWQAKEIGFSDQDKRTTISVFFHDEEGYLFIGHTGILIPAEDGKLLFIEKISFHMPYQAIKFNNRIELNDYLMNKYDISWNQPTADPFIMENDHLLEVS